MLSRRSFLASAASATACLGSGRFVLASQKQDLSIAKAAGHDAGNVVRHRPNSREVREVEVDGKPREVTAWTYSNLEPYYKAICLADETDRLIYAKKIRLYFPRVNWYIREGFDPAGHITDQCGTSTPGGSITRFYGHQLVPSFNIGRDCDNYHFVFHRRGQCDKPQTLAISDCDAGGATGGFASIWINDSYWRDNHGVFDAQLFVLEQ